jgi:CDP-diacylglycerol pyrophosphatase
MPGLRPRRTGHALALRTPVSPSAHDNGVGVPIDNFAAQWLAYRRPCRRFAPGLPTTHGPGPMRFAIPSSQWTCATYSSPASRRTVTVIRAAPFVKQRDRNGRARAWSLKLLIDTYIAIRARVGSRQPATGSAGNDGGSWVAMLAITSRRKARRWLCVALGLSVSVSAFDAPARADPMALWRIVHDECVPRVQAGEGPKPCESVDLSGGVEEGVAILKDLVGVAQMLAIPTRRITGIEDPQMLAPNAPKVFFAAWKAKPLVEARLHHALPREAIAIAINSKFARTQDQLHLHVDCVAISVADTLADAHSSLDDTWRAMTVPLHGRVYLARRLDSADLSDVQPLRLLAAGVEGASAHMAAYSLAAIGATFDGKPGFVLLADQFSLEGGGHAEDLQDHDCAIAHSAP